MTYLEVMKHIVETDPWEIAHRLWNCFECPKLKECNILQQKLTHDCTGVSNDQAEEVCRECINSWLNEEVVGG